MFCSLFAAVMDEKPLLAGYNESRSGIKLTPSYLTFVYADHDDGDGDDAGDGGDACYSFRPSHTPVSRGLGLSCASIVPQWPCQRTLPVSRYPGTSCRHRESSWNV